MIMITKGSRIITTDDEYEAYEDWLYVPAGSVGTVVEGVCEHFYAITLDVDPGSVPYWEPEDLYSVCKSKVQLLGSPEANEALKEYYNKKITEVKQKITEAQAELRYSIGELNKLN